MERRWAERAAFSSLFDCWVGVERCPGEELLLMCDVDEVDESEDVVENFF